MRNYEDRAKDFIKMIAPIISNCDTPHSVRMAMLKFNADNHRAVHVASGLARIAMITSDYVVKFDYDEYEVESIGGCEREIELYAEAEKDGFAYLFAKITRFEYAGRKYYIMPRIRNIHHDSWDYADKFMTAREHDWCDDHDLTDLHSSNYGFRNGRVCIFDYACRQFSSTDSEE